MNTLIAVQYPILRDGIKKVLSEESEISIKNAARDRSELFSLPLAGECILILDLNFSDLNRENMVRRLLEKSPELDILAISEDENRDNIKEIMQAGASGYISKEQSTNELVKALKKINQGDIYLSDETIGMLYNEKDNLTENRNPSVELTEREIEVLVMICKELTNREIAQKLSISVRTVDAHRRNILQKTGAENTAGLVKYAIKHQIYNL